MEEQAQQELTSPETEARVRESFGQQGLMTHLGARITRVTPGRVDIGASRTAGGGSSRADSRP
ncbi:hypothetical protein [Streptomyces sp. NPDC057002]|uniref:hypothetical protein n=1 Tax=Streptomyces sp. NPDC057002 TaxID=3345992 RepID=UPI00362A2F0E